MWLDWNRINWFHCANEGMHKVQYRKKMSRLGVKPGMPDIVIIDPPPNVLAAPGAVIELKRIKGGKVSDGQLAWLSIFKQRGWAWAVCMGADEALGMLEKWGYGKAKN